MDIKERTLVIIKPDGIQKKLIGEIISRIEREGLKITNLKMMRISKELAEKHYDEHKKKPFYRNLINFITSASVVVMIVEGEDVISTFRLMMGPTDSRKAASGTIRGDYGLNIERNIIHGSDSIKSAKREISLFFQEEYKEEV